VIPCADLSFAFIADPIDSRDVNTGKPQYPGVDGTLVQGFLVVTRF